MTTSIRRFWLPLAALLAAAGAARADTVALTGGSADGSEILAPASHSLSAPARRASNGERLPASAADVAAKAAADAAYDAAMREGKAIGSRDVASMTADGRLLGGPAQPAAKLSIQGRYDAGATPPDTTGAMGTKRYIQMVNGKVGLYDRTSSNKALPTFSLTALAGFSADTFDPQVIWDSTTNRFYYMMDAVVSASDNRLAFGFSKNSAPSSAADFCKYFVNYGAEFPDYPKLGDNRNFLLAGVNVYDAAENFLRSDLMAIPKPSGTAAIPTCPSFAALTGSRALIFGDIRDSQGNPVFSPAPANQVDGDNTGYAVGRNWSIPATRLWVVAMGGTATGNPFIGTVRPVSIPNTPIPPNARQPGFSQLLDTSDTRMTQVVMAKNPARNNAFSLWTQQTIANGTTGSQIQFYEIGPHGSNDPVRLRSGTIASEGSFLFNAAISPDRRVSKTSTGSSFVVGYSAVSRSNGVNPTVMAASSVNGAAVSFKKVKSGSGPYRDFACPNSGDVCRWGDYSGATPDPAPPSGIDSAVTITNQWSPGGSMPINQANWRTWIANLVP
jgi:hypothetical protein